MRIHPDGTGAEGAPSGPVGRMAGAAEERRATRSTVVATGTLACPECDAPVSPGPRALSPAEALQCPVCAHAGAVRDFLSLATPSRPARVRVVISQPGLVIRGAD
ncbi:MAG: hypothetical protein M3417_00680 [Actinomycetota bacterium]|nr:hypothetical protein [Actinomycetota bacterium]